MIHMRIIVPQTKMDITFFIVSININLMMWSVALPSCRELVVPLSNKVLGERESKTSPPLQLVQVTVNQGNGEPEASQLWLHVS